MAYTNGAPWANDGRFDIAQLAHVEIFSPDPAGTEEFFTRFLGLEVSGREGQSVYMRAHEEWYHSSLKVTEAAEPGVGHVAWRAASPDALQRRVAAIEESGRSGEWVEDLGHGPAYSFQLPSGQSFEILWEVEYAEVPDGERSGVINRPQRRPVGGVPVRRIDHVGITAPDVALNREFFERQLGFKTREYIVAPDESTLAGAWLSVSQMVHEIAIVADPAGLPGRFHHICYWYGVPQHCSDAAELLREYGYTIECGPGKHGLAQGIYVYAIEPGGNRVELYGDCGYQIQDPAWKPVRWNADELEWGKSVYGTVTDSFFEYATPPVGTPLPVASTSL